MEQQLKQAEFKACRNQMRQALRLNNLELLTQVLTKYPSLITDDINPVCRACMWGSDSLIEKLITTNIEYDKWFQQQLEPVYSFGSENFRKHIDSYVVQNYWKSVLLEAFKTSIYYARPKCLQKILHIADSHNVNLQFDPNSSDDDKINLEWVVENIKQNKRVGWNVGPDSGPWPSDLWADYKAIYDTLIQKFIKKH